MSKTKVAINYKDLINILYDGEATENLKENIIETPELHAQYCEYFEAYIEPIYKERGFDVGADADVGLGGLITAYEKRGFEMGFRTAVALFTGKAVQA